MALPLLDRAPGIHLLYRFCKFLYLLIYFTSVSPFSYSKFLLQAVSFKGLLSLETCCREVWMIFWVKWSCCLWTRWRNLFVIHVSDRFTNHCIKFVRNRRMKTGKSRHIWSILYADSYLQAQLQAKLAFLLNYLDLPLEMLAAVNMYKSLKIKLL